MQLDAKALAAATAEIVKTHVAAAAAPLLRRIEALETRPMPERGEKGDRGDGGEAGPAGRDGVGVRDAFLQREGVLVLTLTDGTTRELGAVVGKDGAQGPPGEAGPRGDPGEKGEKGEPGADGKAGKDGADADMAAAFASVDERVGKAVATAVAEIPPAERGEKGEPGDRGSDGAAGKDGAGIADLMIDKEGGLVATLDDGRIKSLGQVSGKDGRDGFSLDDFDVTAKDDGRSIELSFVRGDAREIYELTFPVVIDRGVFKEGETYHVGDGVTWGGSWWIAQKETGAKPDSPESGFRLAVKRGRDGKDAKAA